MKSVLIITDVTAPGGVDTYIAALCWAARNRGWASFVLMDDGDGSDGLADRLTAQPTPLRRGPLYHRAYMENLRAAATREALAWSKPDVVHAVCGAPWTTVVPREVACEAGLPLVFVEQYVAEGFTFEPGLHARIQRLYRDARAVVAVSRHNLALLRVYGFESARSPVIPNSVAMETNSVAATRSDIVARFQLPDREIQAVCVARLHHQKGIDTLIESLSQLPANIRERFHIAVLGDGPDREMLGELARQKKVEDVMKFAGWCDDPRTVLSAFDLFVLPSRSEGQPFALLEAMAESVPVVACAAGGIPEALDGGRVGTLIEVGDAGGLAAAIESFVNDPEPAREKARQALGHVCEVYNQRINLAKTIDLWERAKD